MFDPMTLVFVLRPELCPVTGMHIRVDEKGFTREEPGTVNAQVCLDSNAEDFFQVLFEEGGGGRQESVAGSQESDQKSQPQSQNPHPSLREKSAASERPRRRPGGTRRIMRSKDMARRGFLKRAGASAIAVPGMTLVPGISNAGRSRDGGTEAHRKFLTTCRRLALRATERRLIVLRSIGRSTRLRPMAGGRFTSGREIIFVIRFI